MISHAMAIRTAEAAITFDEVCSRIDATEAQVEQAAHNLRAVLDEYRAAKAIPDVEGDLVLTVEVPTTDAG